jgi:cyclopropane fatty-acyl-phospholipid synthase-like methyltransferase
VTDVLDPVRSYYAAKVAAHGATAAGVDWNSPESQRLRFDQLLRLCEGDAGFTLLDFGCGYGALADYLAERQIPCHYTGYDIVPGMLDAARKRVRPGQETTFTDHLGAMEPRDYVVASGVFNVRLDAELAAWEQYVHGTLEQMARLSTRGLAFNLLTAYSDPERRRTDLFYADPALMLTHCLRHFGRRAALLHDYPLYEFTVLVRL